MILCDTGVIVAAVNPNDPHRNVCMQILATVREPLITTWPCLTEAMYLVGTAGQEKLRRQLEQGAYVLPDPTLAHVLRACALMRKYADIPMDFAGASLVVSAEVLGVTRILTFDAHFYAYRIGDRTPFSVLP